MSAVGMRLVWRLLSILLCLVVVVPSVEKTLFFLPMELPGAFVNKFTIHHTDTTQTPHIHPIHTDIPHTHTP